MNGSSATSSSYDEIMVSGSKKAAASGSGGGGADALASRLVTFRKWLTTEANCTVHPSVCIVNGEATDGTKNAPVLLFGPPPSSTTGDAASSSASGSGGTAGGGTGGSGGGSGSSVAERRCGLIDRDADRALYDRTMGCQIRAAREIKKDETMMVVPRVAMITPDLVAASDAGRAVLACCQPLDRQQQQQRGQPPNFWDVFENTTIREKIYMGKTSSSSGTQLLVKILQERKKAERVLAEAEKRTGMPEGGYTLAANGTIATRAPLLAFLIHQRFYGDMKPPVKSTTVRSFATDIGTKKEPDASDEVLLPSPSGGTPKSFGPYARTLPSYISIPICWKRNELALLAGCIVGTHPLQKVAARTMQLSADLIALIKGGLLHRFPDVFPPGLITWDRWVWAASVLASRSLPASCYLDRSDGCAADHRTSTVEEQFYSPPEVWDELGVMVPLLDMLNHEGDANQVTWQPPLGADAGQSVESIGENPHDAKAIMHKRVKKGCQIYTSYGVMENSHMVGSYGFAQINNPSDEVKIGWGLFDGVGNVPPPAGYDVSLELEGVEGIGDGGVDLDKQYLVYEAAGNEAATNQWWTDDRLALLQKEAMVDNRFVDSLKAGKKMNALAYSDGNYHPLFLTAAVVATMPPEEVKRQAPILLSPEGAQSSIALTKRHQHVLRRYLIFFLSQKLEKLLQNLNNGLKAHFNNVELWTKATDGGLQYNAADSGSGNAIGWQAFFDSYAYATSMEVEKRYYAMGSDSCVLTLYDGSLRALQVSIDGVRIHDKFAKGVLKQLEDFNMNVARDETDSIPRKLPSSIDIPRKPPQDAPAPEAVKPHVPSNGQVPYSQSSASAVSAAPKTEKTPAVKLHVGNLSYATGPSDLFEYFSGLYGRENVLECHIPTERETNRSRGFGFVTMPKEIAALALDSGRKHQIGDRLVKVAASNTAGSGRNPSGAAKGQIASDRCATCGYRPKYCACQNPNIPAGGGGVDAASYHSGSNTGSRPPEEIYGPPLGSSHDYGAGHYDRPFDDYSRSSRRRSRSRSPRGRDGRSHSPRLSSRSSRGDRSRDRYYDEYRRRSYSRSRSRDRGRDGDKRDRSRRERDRDRDRDRDRRSRRSYSRSRSRSRDRGGGRSDRRDRDDEKRERKRRYRSRSRSRDRSGKRERKRSSKGSSNRKDSRD